MQGCVRRKTYRIEARCTAQNGPGIIHKATRPTSATSSHPCAMSVRPPPSGSVLRRYKVQQTNTHAMCAAERIYSACPPLSFAASRSETGSSVARCSGSRVGPDAFHRFMPQRCRMCRSAPNPAIPSAIMRITRKMGGRNCANDASYSAQAGSMTCSGAVLFCA